MVTKQIQLCLHRHEDYSIMKKKKIFLDNSDFEMHVFVNCQPYIPGLLMFALKCLPIVNRTCIPGIVPFVFLPLVMEQQGVSSEGTGLVIMVGPLIGLATNACTSVLADAYKVHQKVVVSGNVILLLSFFVFIFLPPVREPVESTENVVVAIRSRGNGIIDLKLYPKDSEGVYWSEPQFAHYHLLKCTSADNLTSEEAEPHFILQYSNSVAANITGNAVDSGKLSLDFTLKFTHGEAPYSSHNENQFQNS